MKKAGLIIFAIGIVITIFTGLNYTTKEVVLNSGNMNLTRDVEPVSYTHLDVYKRQLFIYLINIIF